MAVGKQGEKMSYRPITDFWFLTRAKLKDGKKYYGAYLGGFPERARILIGCSINDSVLHVCGGMAKYYPYSGGFGKNDFTLDIDPSLNPDYIHDAEIPFNFNSFSGAIIDPPYTESDALNYWHKKYPSPNKILKNTIDALDVGCRAGIIHYIVPSCPKNAKFIACVGIVSGFNNRIRVFSVYEKIV